MKSFLAATAVALFVIAGLAMSGQNAPKRTLPGQLDPEKAKAIEDAAKPGAKPAAPVLSSNEELDGPVFRSRVQTVLVPTTVTDRRGKVVNGLRVNDFILYDNDKPQKIERDIGFLPLSIVVCIQRNSDVDVMLPKIQRIGNLLHDMVVGQEGEAAILSFDHRIDVLQEFTNDADLLNKAVLKIKPGGQNARLNDAVQQATRMLKYKKDRRKVILLISDTVDKSSEVRPREVANDLQMHNIDVFTLNISHLLTTLTKKADTPRPDPFPPGARPHPAGTSIDPTTMAQMDGSLGNSADFIPVIEEMYRQAKRVFIREPGKLYTRMTGGRMIGFSSQADLEQALTQIGSEIRSQYILSYSPNTKLEGGFHTIKVDVDREGYKVHTRPGYWMAAVPD